MGNTKFHKVLIQWYLQNKRDLPWRSNRNPYLIWLSEIILQQTRIAQGLNYFLKFKEHFPTVHDLAEASENNVLKLWQGLGYYSRARNLHATAQYVSRHLKGIFPNTYNDLLKLKGVGDYTASAIASICYNEPAAVVDGNVYRVLARFFGIETPINTSAGVKKFKQLAQELIDRDEPGIYNQALMEFGSLQCKPQNPDCKICPLKNACVAYRMEKVATLPVKEKKLKIRNRFFHYLIFITSSNKTVLEQRKGKGIWQGLYQFPLIEVSNANTNILELDIFHKNVPEEAKVSLLNTTPITHKLSHQHLYTHFWKIELHQYDKATVDLTDFTSYPVPALIAKFIEQTELL